MQLNKQKKEQSRTTRKYQTQISQERNVNTELAERLQEQKEEKVSVLALEKWGQLIDLKKYMHLCNTAKLPYIYVLKQRTEKTKEKLRQVSKIVNGQDREARSRTREPTRTRAGDTTISSSGKQ